MVLTPRRWRQAGGGNFAGDGGKRARSPGRARHKPLKPLRAGMPGVPVRPWRLPRVPHYTLHTRLRVQRAPGIPHALNRAKDKCTTRALHVARFIRMSGDRHCERSEAIHSFFARRDGLLRFARNDGKHTFATSPRHAPEPLMNFPPIEGVGNAGCPLHPRSRVHL